MKLKDICLESIANGILLNKSPLKASQVDIEISSRSTEGQPLLPLTLSQELFDFCIRQTSSDDINRVLQFFNKAPHQTPLQALHLENSTKAKVSIIRSLVEANKFNLTHVDVRGCQGLPKSFWVALNEAKFLQSLITTELTPLKCSSLKCLVVDWRPRKVFQRVRGLLDSTYYDDLLKNVLPNLKYLDLSWCPWIKKLKCLATAEKLEVLILRNSNMTGLIDDIAQLKNLKVLNISIGLDNECTRHSHGRFLNPEAVLEKIFVSLEKLEYLDISGTNLVESRWESEVPFMQWRHDRPLKFLGIYSPDLDESRLETFPASDIGGSSQSDMILESIKRNHDMPKTLQDQLFKLRYLSQERFIQGHMRLLTTQLIRVVKNVRHTESGYSLDWTLSCVQYFLEHFLSPTTTLPEDLKADLTLALTRLTCSFSMNERVPEVLLCQIFQILIELLSTEKLNYGKLLRREVFRLADFVLSLSSATFLYLRTEALLSRLIFKVSHVPEAAAYLGDNEIIMMCFDFFRTLQIYIGYQLSYHQVSTIIPRVWTAIMHFMLGSDKAINDFVKRNGLWYMKAHFEWFKGFNVALGELASVFEAIVKILEDNCNGLPRGNVLKIIEMINQHNMNLAN